MSAQPFDQHNLSVGDGHLLYVAQYGQAHGPATVVLHGGPGSGTQPSVLDWFDLSRQRVVLFDQRGAGMSQPQGSLIQNDSRKLVDDIELIRSHLGIQEWRVVGGSWGATLALLYAGQHTERISALILRGSFLASTRELQWFFQDLRAMVPQGWASMTSGWSSSEQAEVLKTLCHALLHGDPSRASDAAQRWARYENAVMEAMSGKLDSVPTEASGASARTLNKYRLQAHYLSHACFTNQAALVQATQRLHATPVTLIHGTHDLICPPENAMKLHSLLPHATMRWVAKGGHTPADAGIAAALKAAAQGI